MAAGAFVFRFILLASALLALMGLINYIADPLWMYRGSQSFAIRQVDFNERQQKTNYLRFRDHDFNALLLGNSRSTYIDQNAFTFGGVRVFNYACNAMFQNEYDGFIETFQKLTGQAPKYVIIGMDFIYGRPDNDYEAHLEAARAFERRSAEPFYRVRSLFLSDVFRHSLQNLKKTWDAANGVYDRKQRFYDTFNVKGSFTPNEVDYSALFAQQVPEGIGVRDFRADREYYAYLRNKYPDSQFVIFIPPVPNEVLRTYHERGIDPAFLEWVRELTNSFGKVYNFMYPNPVSEAGRNFFDAAHFYPNVGRMIAGQISTEMGAAEDFGVVLTPENVEAFIREYPLRFETGRPGSERAKDFHAI